MLKFIAIILFAQVLVAAPVPADLTNGGSLLKRDTWSNPIPGIAQRVISSWSELEFCVYNICSGPKVEPLIYDTYGPD